MTRFRAVAPGRVNLIGEHTDYTGGLVLPMAIDRFTVIEGTRGGERVRLTSTDQATPIDLPTHVDDPGVVEPAWGRFVGGVLAEVESPHGIDGRVTTTIPIGAGLSSSAALEVATALAVGYRSTPRELAQLCQRAEHRATGVPTGIMDQLAITSGVAGHAMLIDCATLDVEPVALPAGMEVVVMFVAHRTLVGSPYADRVRECAAAGREIGPLRLATEADAARITDPVVRDRALHVTSENRRVREMVAALRAGDMRSAGRLLVEGHASLRDHYATSTPQMDAAVAQLCAVPGVFGARMTGGGFGGCVVALAEPGALRDGWVVRAVAGATCHDDPEP